MENLDPMVVYDRVCDDMISGNLESALQGLSWIFLHGAETDPMFNVLRRTYGLGTWRQLAGRYPAAQIALRNLHDEKLAQLVGDSSNASLIADVAALKKYSC